MSIEKHITAEIHKALSERIASIIDAEAKEAVARVESRVRALTADVACNAAKYYRIEPFHDKIVITVSIPETKP